MIKYFRILLQHHKIFALVAPTYYHFIVENLIINYLTFSYYISILNVIVREFTYAPLNNKVHKIICECKIF